MSDIATAGLPGTIFTSERRQAPPGIPTDTGTGFMVALAASGPVGESRMVRSSAEYDAVYGDGSGVYGLYQAAADVFFGKGGANLHVSRAAGAAAAPATVTLMDRAATPVATLQVDAQDVGAAANGAGGGYTITVEDGDVADTFTIVVLLDGAEVERFADLATPTAAVTALAASGHVTATDLASASVAPTNNPAAVVAAALAGGDDDVDGLTDASWQTALDVLGADLGPGQVFMPGRTTAVAHGQLAAHARLRNRVSLVDLVDGVTVAAADTAADLVAALDGADRAWIGATWANIPPRVAGVARVAPPSARMAGVIAHVDALFDPGTWPIGERGRGRSTYRTTATKTYTASERRELTLAGVNVAVDDAVGFREYGFRAADGSNFAHARLTMAIQADTLVLREQFVGQRITNATIAEFGGLIRGILDGYYQSGALDGDDPAGVEPSSPARAYFVDVGPSVNTPETRAAQELRAQPYVRYAANAELVSINLVVLPLSQPIAA